MAKKDDGPVNHYICQLYEERKAGPAGMQLAVKGTFPYTSPGRPNTALAALSRQASAPELMPTGLSLTPIPETPMTRCS